MPMEFGRLPLAGLGPSVYTACSAVGLNKRPSWPGAQQASKERFVSFLRHVRELSSPARRRALAASPESLEMEKNYSGALLLRRR